MIPFVSFFYSGNHDFFSFILSVLPEFYQFKKHTFKAPDFALSFLYFFVSILSYILSTLWVYLALLSLVSLGSKVGY